MALVAALPQHPDDLDGLLEHLEAHIGFGPAVAEDVLVERFAESVATTPAMPTRSRRSGAVKLARVAA
jgi:hypothetical protein